MCPQLCGARSNALSENYVSHKVYNVDTRESVDSMSHIFPDKSYCFFHISHIADGLLVPYTVVASGTLREYVLDMILLVSITIRSLLSS